MSDAPSLISVITPSLNRASFISEAIDSILHQDYPAFEHIILDGGSSDGTLEILKRYHHLRVVSEIDQGLYDALNKGVSLARGEFIGFLNTDDFYEPYIFEEIAEVFRKASAIQTLVGGAKVFKDVSGGKRETVAAYPPVGEKDIFDRISWGVPIFNAWFFRRQIFEHFGGFDIRYKFIADRDFLIRLALKNVKIASFKKNIYNYRQHADSLTVNEFGGASDAFFVEKQNYAESLLARKDIPKSIRKRFLKWHSVIVSDRVLAAVRENRWIRALDYAGIGLIKDPLWPLSFLRRALPYPIRRFMKPFSQMFG
jgi:glycosyltransferase involved in cell wall biosynthesis